MPSSKIPAPLPLCFVAMPFGTKTHPDDGSTVNFDEVYDQIIEPAILGANMAPLRADAERLGGVIHKPMFERLILSDFVVADLTTANANVFYELGIRHAVRPHTTILIGATGRRLPFDLAPVRTHQYSLDGASPSNATNDSDFLGQILSAAKRIRGDATDSPVFQLLDGFGPPDIERLRTDSFRDRVQFAREADTRLKAARTSHDPAAALAEIRAELGEIEDVEAGTTVSLLLAYRSVKDYEAMILLVDDMPPVLRRTTIVREQRAFALNRLGRRDDAVQELDELIAERGPSSETLGLLGRVHKDRWSEAVKDGDTIKAAAHLSNAIETYLAGFEADWRDAYPGINALTLMSLAEPPDPRRHEIGPVVVYSAKQRAQSNRADYWDHATLLEAALLAGNRSEALDALGRALAAPHDPWQAQTTLDNVTMVLAAASQRGDAVDWHSTIEDALAASAGT